MIKQANQTTRVVNLYDEFYDVYIGRAGRGEEGCFGNPIKRGEFCLVCDEIYDSSGDTLPCYRKYLYWRVEYDPEFRKKLQGLRGKVLSCFCKPRLCHGDVIVEWLEENDV